MARRQPARDLYLGLDPITAPNEANHNLREGLIGFRMARGFTRKQLADALAISEETLRKYERGDRGIPNSLVVKAVTTLGIPKMLIPRIPWLLLQGLYTYEVGSTPQQLTRADLIQLESQRQPALYNSFPALDILASNTRMLEYAPFLRPAAPGGRPVNLLEEVVTNPAAKEVFGDSWATVAGGLAVSFRTMAAGMVPQERVEEILARCGTNPDFSRLLVIEGLTEESFTSSRVVMRVPETREYKEHEIISCGQDFPTQGWKMTVFVRSED
ncbi:helix-turn-helix domain-containing protein [Nocardia otitidiscaviarum]|uniref:helix-turn-helix domain-containing protein n=1 Tax=Nocardia otitidiscaviarum TaxID=1823 RepID=UPI0004A6E22A|nr:helix-turn-helix domain-containing protein [Nocardia otitidiscaviarum]MBF6137511.1 helix-turn-helix domain-containing protein [Nocardia otitidiscaviarum]MBF6488227.1 helix-turn-helix domain-containing protein [Nocardia otitidiscaviarum]